MLKDFESSHQIQLGSIAGRLERIKHLVNTQIRSGSFPPGFHGSMVKAIDACINETGSLSMVAGKNNLKDVSVEAEVLKSAAWEMLEFMIATSEPQEGKEITVIIYHKNRVSKWSKHF